MRGQRMLVARPTPRAPSTGSSKNPGKQLVLVPSKGGAGPRRWQDKSGEQGKPSGRPKVPDTPEFRAWLQQVHDNERIHVKDHQLEEGGHAHAAAWNGLVTVHDNPSHYAAKKHVRISEAGRKHVAGWKAEREARHQRAQTSMFKAVVVQLFKGARKAVVKLKPPGPGEAGGPHGEPKEPEQPHSVPPTKVVKYTCPATNKERTAKVIAGAHKGITAIDTESGKRIELHHGFYVAHDDDDENEDEAPVAVASTSGGNGDGESSDDDEQPDKPGEKGEDDVER